MNEQEFQIKMQELDHQMSLEHRKSDFNRARSISVGTTFNNMTDLSIRSNDGICYWVPMHAHEVVRLIDQLALSINCQVEFKEKLISTPWNQKEVVKSNIHKTKKQLEEEK